jgi:hypothetical protein
VVVLGWADREPHRVCSHTRFEIARRCVNRQLHQESQPCIWPNSFSFFLWPDEADVGRHWRIVRDRSCWAWVLGGLLKSSMDVQQIPRGHRWRASSSLGGATRQARFLPCAMLSVVCRPLPEQEEDELPAFAVTPASQLLQVQRLVTTSRPSCRTPFTTHHIESI